MSEDMVFKAASELYNKITDGTHESPEPRAHGKPLITSKHIKGREIDFQSAYLISHEDFNKINERSKVEQWDVIVSMIGEYCGFCYVERNESIDYAVKNVGLYKAGSKLEAEWLYYYLNSPIGKDQLKLIRSGSSQPYLTLGGLRNLRILQPRSHREKEKIVSLLSTLDSKISINNRINAELEAMAKLIYDYWFVQFDFPISKEQAKAMGKPKLEGKPYKASGGKMVWSEELKREVPEGWGVGTVNDVGEIIGGSTPSTQDGSNFSTSGTPWITPKDLSLNTGNKFITRGELCVTTKGIKNASLKIMPPGTILLSSRAPIGYMAIARENTTSNQGFKNVIPNKGYSTEVVYYLIKNLIPVIEQNSSGSTFKEISGSVLKTIRLVLPPKILTDELTSLLKPIFSKQDLLERESKKLSELRDWLLPMLMNGQVKMKDVEEKLAMAAEPETVYQ